MLKSSMSVTIPKVRWRLKKCQTSLPRPPHFCFLPLQRSLCPRRMLYRTGTAKCAPSGSRRRLCLLVGTFTIEEWFSTMPPNIAGPSPWAVSGAMVRVFGLANRWGQTLKGCPTFRLGGNSIRLQLLQAVSWSMLRVNGSSPKTVMVLK